MQIVYLYPALDTVGGADRVITGKANYLAERCGYRVYIITAHQNNKPFHFPLSPKVRHIDLGVDFTKQYGRSFLVRSLIYLKLQRLYRSRLSGILHKLRADITITTISRDTDFLHKIKDGSRKIAEAHIAKPYIRNIHLMLGSKGIYNLVGRIWTRRLEKAVKRFDALVVLTGRDAESWRNVREAVVIPNPLPFYPQESSSCLERKVITVGRLDEQKGYDMLIEAWETVHRKHPDWVLTAYGSGVLRDRLDSLIRDKALGKAFVISPPVGNIRDKYLECSIYVMSSRFEGFGMVLAEAMACGVPCVAFDCPHGPADVIKDGEDGILVGNGDVSQLAGRISYLIEHREERIRMGSAARENIKRYAPDLVMGQWLSLFGKLTNDNK